MKLKFKPYQKLTPKKKPQNLVLSLSSFSSLHHPHMAPEIETQSPPPPPSNNNNDNDNNNETLVVGGSGSPINGCLSSTARVERAWAHWTKLGRPKYIVAPMVDNSELPFRILCRKYGAQGAYTPMLHSRIFTESEKYRAEEFTTCQV